MRQHPRPTGDALATFQPPPARHSRVNFAWQHWPAVEFQMTKWLQSYFVTSWHKPT